MPRDLDKVERRTVANAIQLIREAGYRDKAAKLDDMLQEGDLDVDPGLSAQDIAVTETTTIPLIGAVIGCSIHLNPNLLKLKKGAPPKPVDRPDPDLVVLASTLLHEADHALGHDELDAYGEEIAFCKIVKRLFGELFPGATPAQKKAVEDEADALEKLARRKRDRIAERGGPGEGLRSLRGLPPGLYRLGDLPIEVVRLRFPPPSLSEPDESDRESVPAKGRRTRAKR